MTRFNQEGLAALRSHRSSGRKPSTDATARERILTEARRTPDPQQDGTAIWSLTTLQRALRKAPDGLPHVSTYTIFRMLHDASFRWLAARSWCETGRAVRKRRKIRVRVRDPVAEAKKKLIERAYCDGAQQGLAVWTEDEAGLYQTRHYAGQSWAEHGQARHQPHGYLYNGTAKLLTLFRPGSGEVRVRGVISASNAVLQPWLQQELLEILVHLPTPGRSLVMPIRSGGLPGKKG